jgi:peptidoglycan hydrolase CwlO-like protein
MFKWIVGLTALFIAGCAAFFSVTGIAQLFSGSLLGVAIMAGSLELGKLIAASYLHRKWNQISLLFRIYFTTAVIALIFITSMGIFGYLSNAYQKTALEVAKVESQVQILETQKEGVTNDLQRFDERIQILSDQRSSQETRYDSLVAGENWVNARRTFNLIESADDEILSLNEQITLKREELNDINTEILSIQSDNIDVAREIGGFQFIADAFNVDIDTAVKWFIILLIFVFDPLAVSLVIAFNSLFEKKELDVYRGEITEEDLERFDKAIKRKQAEQAEQVKEKQEEEQPKDISVGDLIQKTKDLGAVASKSQPIPNTKKGTYQSKI